LKITSKQEAGALNAKSYPPVEIALETIKLKDHVENPGQTPLKNDLKKK